MLPKGAKVPDASFVLRAEVSLLCSDRDVLHSECHLRFSLNVERG